MYSGLWLRLLVFSLVVTACAEPYRGHEIYVATTGKGRDAAGTVDDPFSSINRAAEHAQPGDTIIIHGGTYRELIHPAIGGTSEDRRITYKAAPGETVIVKGSERITTWEPAGKGIWKVELPFEFFGDYNPYYLKLTGGWLRYGTWHHRGDVYLDGDALYERETEKELSQEKSWYCEVVNGVTTIRANFGNSDPNVRLTEINVRQNIFFPDVSGLQYITIDGLQFMHSAENWQPPTLRLQGGAVGTRMGKRWIIQNCTVINARCVGISLGSAPGVGKNIGDFGEHIVRNNIIRRCGQAGLGGSSSGATRCEILNNLIEDTNYRKEFGGWETGAIKFHGTVDVHIAGNLIRGVYHQSFGAYGIWLDYANQGSWIADNIIYKTEEATIFLEMDHGPMLIENNILAGNATLSRSEAEVYAHNLFVDNGYSYNPDTVRMANYYKPHTLEALGSKNGTARDDKWFNNIFIRAGLDDVKPAPGYVIDYNVYLEGAKKTTFGDEHSRVDPFVTGIAFQDDSVGATITFNMNDTPFGMNGPMVDPRLVGVFPTSGQTIEDRWAHPITVNTDINGKKFTKPLPGPLSDLKPGLNTVRWSYKKWTGGDTSARQ